MFALIPLIVVVAVVVGVFVWQRRRGRAAGAGEWRRAAGETPLEVKEKPAKAASRPMGPGFGSLAADLSRWVGAGLISAEQADTIAGFERAATTGHGPK